MTTPLQPTAQPPRSAGKLEILAARAALGVPLHVPGDAGLADNVGLLAGRSRNGAGTYCAALVLRDAGGAEILEAYSRAPARSWKRSALRRRTA
jgi:hypothetical protein